MTVSTVKGHHNLYTVRPRILRDSEVLENFADQILMDFGSQKSRGSLVEYRKK